MTNAVNNTFQGFKHIVVPKPQDSIAMLVQRFRSGTIVGQSITMLPAIKFHNNFRIVACEVSDETCERDLPAEVASLRFKQLELLPKNAFSGCSIVAKIAGELIRHRATPTPALPTRGRGNVWLTTGHFGELSASPAIFPIIFLMWNDSQPMNL